MLTALTGGSGHVHWALTGALDGEEHITILTDLDARQVTVTVTEAPGRSRTSRAPLGPGERHALRVFLDGSLVEVLVDDGCALTTRSYPDGGFGTARLTATGSVLLNSVDAWSLTTGAVP